MPSVGKEAPDEQGFRQGWCALEESMRMLMDGRLVALSEEERRLMRAAAATSKHDSEQLLRPSLGRATADSEPCTPMRGFPSLSAWSGSEKGASLGTPAHDDPPTQRSRSRCASVV